MREPSVGALRPAVAPKARAASTQILPPGFDSIDPAEGVRGASHLEAAIRSGTSASQPQEMAAEVAPKSHRAVPQSRHPRTRVP